MKRFVEIKTSKILSVSVKPKNKSIILFFLLSTFVYRAPNQITRRRGKKEHRSTIPRFGHAAQKPLLRLYRHKGNWCIMDAGCGLHLLSHSRGYTGEL